LLLLLLISKVVVVFIVLNHDLLLRLSVLLAIHVRLVAALLLLDQKLLQLTHLLTVKIKSHFLSGSNQLWINLRVTILILVFILIFSVLIIIFVLFSIVELLFVDDLFDFLVNIVFLPHHSRVCELHWVLLF
jgi:hypothetical protein